MFGEFVWLFFLVVMWERKGAVCCLLGLVYGWLEEGKRRGRSGMTDSL